MSNENEQNVHQDNSQKSSINFDVKAAEISAKFRFIGDSLIRMADHLVKASESKSAPTSNDPNNGNVKESNGEGNTANNPQPTNTEPVQKNVSDEIPKNNEENQDKHQQNKNKTEQNKPDLSVNIQPQSQPQSQPQPQPQTFHRPEQVKEGFCTPRRIDSTQTLYRPYILEPKRGRRCWTEDENSIIFDILREFPGKDQATLVQYSRSRLLRYQAVQLPDQDVPTRDQIRRHIRYMVSKNIIYDKDGRLFIGNLSQLENSPTRSISPQNDIASYSNQVGRSSSGMPVRNMPPGGFVNVDSRSVYDRSPCIEPPVTSIPYVRGYPRSTQPLPNLGFQPMSIRSLSNNPDHPPPRHDSPPIGYGSAVNKEISPHNGKRTQ